MRDTFATPHHAQVRGLLHFANAPVGAANPALDCAGALVSFWVYLRCAPTRWPIGTR